MNRQDPPHPPVKVHALNTPTHAHGELTTGHGIDAIPTRAADVPATTSHQIGPYSVIKTLGQGGMGVVYLAKDERTGREVALKVIPAGANADPTDLARFRTEANAVAKLVHPNIVRLFEVGQTEDVAYIAMEYVDGGTLYRLISRGGPLNAIEAAKLMESIARAVEYAHSNGVLHRDLKPSNILLTSVERAEDTGEKLQELSGQTDAFPAARIPKLADFGLAKELDRSLHLTRSGTAVGTPNYMSPEQARGEKRVGPALDIHGLGAILYEMLTGVPPYSGADAAETMEQVVHKTPVPPAEVRPGIPPALSEICLKCLEKLPRRRYRTAKALADDLQRFLNNPTDATFVVTSPARRSYRPGWLVGASVGALLLIALAAAGTWYIANRQHRDQLQALQEAQAEVEKTHRRAQLDSAIALCEQGHVRLGIERMKPLLDDQSLPVAELIEAWQGRVPTRVATLPVAGVKLVALSPNASLLALTQGNTIRVWNVQTGADTGIEWKTEESVVALGWSEDRTHLAIATASGKVFVGDVETQKLDPTPLVVRQGRSIVAVAFSFPGVRLVFDDPDIQQEYVPAIRTLRAKDEDRFKLKSGRAASVALSPINGDAAIVTTNGVVRFFDSSTARWRELPPDGEVTAVACSPDGNVVAVGTRSGSVRLWDVISRSPLTDSISVGQRVSAITLSATSGNYSIVALPENSNPVMIQCGRPFEGPPIRLAEIPGNEVLGVSFSSDGSKLFVTSPMGVSLWRVRDAKQFSPERDFTSDDRFKSPAGVEARFSAPAAQGPKGTFLVGGSGGRVFLVDSSNGETLHEASGTQDMNEASSVVAGPNGKLSMASTKAGRAVIRHWSNGMGEQPREFEVPCRVHQEVYLADGSALALACDDGRVRIWDPDTNQIRTELDCKSPVLSVATHDDGRHLLAGCFDGSARLWDLIERKEILVVRHLAEVRGVAFQNATFVTASADGTARRWHLSTGIPVGPALRHPDAISAISVWKELVVTGGRSRWVRVWRLP